MKRPAIDVNLTLAPYVLALRRYAQEEKRFPHVGYRGPRTRRTGAKGQKPKTNAKAEKADVAVRKPKVRKLTTNLATPQRSRLRRTRSKSARPRRLSFK